jgi:glycosyltransferase involved in cell wall biosynthesis
MSARVRHVHYRLEPGGGPHGYLFNLRTALADAPAEALSIEVVALPAAARAAALPGAGLRTFLETTPGVRRLRHALRGEFALRFERAEADWRLNYAGLSARDAEALLACDLLFAHETLLAERLVALAPAAARERLVLMTHAPGFYAHQIAGDLCPDEPQEAWRDANVVRRLRERELETMAAVRGVVWPCPGAADGYAEWRRRSTPSEPFVPTGVPRPEPRTPREAMRSRWGVAQDQKVVLFLGRPHPQKGFDRFVDWADAARSDRRWVFVQAGGAPRHSKRDLSAIRQVGYESDNGGAYLAADLVLFPNREAYLDIGLLECLSLGVPVAASRVGGHADLMQGVPDVLAIGQGADAFEALSQALPAHARAESRARRERAWADRHSPARFATAHRAAARALLS